MASWMPASRNSRPTSMTKVRPTRRSRASPITTSTITTSVVLPMIAANTTNVDTRIAPLPRNSTTTTTTMTTTMMTMTSTMTTRTAMKMTSATSKTTPLLTTMAKSMILATLSKTLLKMAVVLAPIVVAAPGSCSFLGPSKTW
ncbi:integumentary mucin C.1-like [Monomorium pharaonis]|uniref:integumentary mucin C.1-like n=1 Tax=Monomorium pharaonis TaxID=307658 RepID=UPI001746CAEA|nr:integumentary mucin C.1-like [Monomorium pharaonis]